MEKKMNEEALPPDQQLDMQLDLLVDEELPEGQRAALLKSLDGKPGIWRELSIRFLQRQVERKAARRIVAGEVAGAAEEEAVVYRFPGALRTMMTRGRLLAVAASVLIAAGSAGLTWYTLREHGAVAGGDGAKNVVAAAAPVATVDLPGNALGMDKALSVEVPVVSSRTESTGASLFMNDGAENAGTPARRSLVIQPDGKGNAIVIPVNTLTNVSWR